MENIAAPTPDKAYSHGWKVMKKNFVEFLFVIVITAFIQAPLNWMQETNSVFQYDLNSLEQLLYSMVTNLYALLYWLIVVIPFSFGASYLFLRAARGEKFEMRAIVAPYNRIVNVVLAEFMVIIAVLIGLILFVIPGIIVMMRLTFVPYLIMDKNLPPKEALKASWEMTSTCGWRIFGMAILSVFILLGGLLFFIVGVMVSVIWIQASFASLYFAVDAKNNSED